jgi:hypothetical protein
MLTVEKQFVAEAVKANDLTMAELGLRFDRVVIGLMDELHEFANTAVPIGTTVLVCVTAPIRMPAKTAAMLRDRIEVPLPGRSSPGDRPITINGNRVRIRILKHSSPQAPRLLGFVHNRSSNAPRLLDLIEKQIVR